LQNQHLKEPWDPLQLLYLTSSPAQVLSHESEVVVENLLVSDGFGRPSLEVEKDGALILQYGNGWQI